jgi:hypothetical protein
MLFELSTYEIQTCRAKVVSLPHSRLKLLSWRCSLWVRLSLCWMKVVCVYGPSGLSSLVIIDYKDSKFMSCPSRVCYTCWTIFSWVVCRPDDNTCNPDIAWMRSVFVLRWGKFVMITWSDAASKNLLMRRCRGDHGLPSSAFAYQKKKQKKNVLFNYVLYFCNQVHVFPCYKIVIFKSLCSIYWGNYCIHVDSKFFWLNL